MAKKCLMEKTVRLRAAKAKDAKRVAEGKKPLTKANVRAYNRCRVCGRRHAYMRKFGGERPHPRRHQGLVVNSERN